MGLERFLIRVITAFAKAPGFVPNTHMMAHTTFNPSARVPDAVFGPLFRLLHAHGTHKFRQDIDIYKNKSLKHL